MRCALNYLWRVAYGRIIVTMSSFDSADCHALRRSVKYALEDMYMLVVANQPTAATSKL